MKKVNRWLFTAVFIVSGIYHFWNPGLYMRLIPEWLPFPLASVYASGVVELLGGIGLGFAPFRKYASWVLTAMLGVFLLVHIAPLENEGEIMEGLFLPMWVIWLRIFFQFLMMAGLIWVGQPDPPDRPSFAGPPG